MSTRYWPGRPYALAHRVPAPSPHDDLIARCPWCTGWHSHGAATVTGDPFLDARVVHCSPRPLIDGRPAMYVLTTDPDRIGATCEDYPAAMIDAAELPPRDLEALAALAVPIDMPDPRRALAPEEPSEVAP